MILNVNFCSFEMMFGQCFVHNGNYLSERLRARGDEDEDDDAGDPQGDGQLAVQESEAPEVGLSGIQHSEKANSCPRLLGLGCKNIALLDHEMRVSRNSVPLNAYVHLCTTDI